MNITLDPALLKRLEKYLSDSSFKEMTELVNFILNDFLDQNDASGQTSFTDTDGINNRLKDLGYF